jgi:hypothetical protein
MGAISMSNAMRLATAVGTCAATAGIAACGSPTTTAMPSPSALVVRPSSSATATASAGTVAASIALVVTDIPAGGPPLTQISNGEMNNQPNTVQRGFANVTNTFRIEDDVLVDTSIQAATADYAQLRDATKAQVTTLAVSTTPTGLGSQANEYIGTTASGYSEIGITFQEGAVIAVLLLENSAGTLDRSFAEAVARVQDQKIIALGF